MAFSPGYHCTCLILGGFFLFFFNVGICVSFLLLTSPTPLPQDAGTIFPQGGRETEARRVSAEREHFAILQPTASGAEQLGLWGYFSSKTCWKFPHLSRTNEGWGEHHAGHLSLLAPVLPKDMTSQNTLQKEFKIIYRQHPLNPLRGEAKSSPGLQELWTSRRFLCWACVPTCQFDFSMLCNLWCSRWGYGITSITRYHWVPVFPFLLSQPLRNLEPTKKKK